MNKNDELREERDKWRHRYWELHNAATGYREAQKGEVGYTVADEFDFRDKLDDLLGLERNDV